MVKLITDKVIRIQATRASREYEMRLREREEMELHVRDLKVSLLRKELDLAILDRKLDEIEKKIISEHI